MPRSQTFWNLIAKRYSRQPIGDEAAYQHKLKTTQGHFRPDMEVLEFGCGTGSTALIHAPFVQSIRAIDYSPRMIEIARAKIVDGKPGNVAFEVGTIEALSAPDASFDAVLGMSILHLLADRDAAIAKVFRMLRPGGFFASSTVCVGDMQGAARWLLPIFVTLRIAPLVKIFGADELLGALKKAGFEIEYQWRPSSESVIFIIARKPL
jgi:ubiquinone/menaquinone biosynthesis C-methylase UbiE